VTTPVSDPSTLRVNATDATPNRKRGGDIRVTLSPVTVGCGSGFGGVLHLEAGEFITRHYHPYSEEFLHVIQGQLELTLDGKPLELGPEDSVLIPIGVDHRLVNVGNVRATAVFHLSPLAPRPELGHVDTEEVLDAGAPQPRVGDAP
jgi:putative monooxygenase